MKTQVYAVTVRGEECTFFIRAEESEEGAEFACDKARDIWWQEPTTVVQECKPVAPDDLVGIALDGDCGGDDDG